MNYFHNSFKTSLGLNIFGFFLLKIVLHLRKHVKWIIFYKVSKSFFVATNTRTRCRTSECIISMNQIKVLSSINLIFTCLLIILIHVFTLYNMFKLWEINPTDWPWISVIQEFGMRVQRSVIYPTDSGQTIIFLQYLTRWLRPLRTGRGMEYVGEFLHFAHDGTHHASPSSDVHPQEAYMTRRQRGSSTRSKPSSSRGHIGLTCWVSSLPIYSPASTVTTGHLRPHDSVPTTRNLCSAA